MSWITISEPDLLEVLSGDELETYREVALGLSQPDPVAEQIAKVTNHVRGFVGGCARNVLGPPGTIPDELLASAIDLLAVRIPSRVGRSPKPGRKDLSDDATDLLKQVAACKFAIVGPEQPAGPSEQPESGAGRPTFKGRQRRDVRRESNGL